MNPVGALQSAMEAVGNAVGGTLSGINHMLGGNNPLPGGGQTPSAYEQALGNVNDWVQQNVFGQRNGANMLSPLASRDSFAGNPALQNYYTRESNANAISPQQAMQNVQGGQQQQAVQYPSWMANTPQQGQVMGAQTMQPNMIPTNTIPPMMANTPVIMSQPVATEAARAYIQNIFNRYHPATPDVPPGWVSPLNNPQTINEMAQAAYANRLHPGLMPLMAIAETQMMRPSAPGTAVNNPFNVQIGGQDYNYNQPGMGLNYAINRYAQNITNNWQGQGWNQFRQNPTLQNLIYKAQNPSDNPGQELGNMTSIANQVGIGENQ